MENEPAIIDQYIRTGRARLVYRHLYQLGDVSEKLAEASECAAEQNSFWEMRALIYEEQDRLYGANSFAPIQPLVRQLGLDEAAFQQCLDSGQFRQQVESDFAASKREGVSTRPVMDINGTRLIGALPIERFQQAIDAAR